MELNVFIETLAVILFLFGMIVFGAYALFSIEKRDVIKGLTGLILCIFLVIIFVSKITKCLRVINSDEYQYEKLVRRRNDAEMRIKKYLNEHPEIKENNENIFVKPIVE